MLKIKLCMFVVAVMLSILALPQVHQNWELDTCIESCRNAFDPLKDPTSNSRCVDQCRRRYQGSMGL